MNFSELSNRRISDGEFLAIRHGWWQTEGMQRENAMGIQDGAPQDNYSRGRPRSRFMPPPADKQIAQNPHHSWGLSAWGTPGTPFLVQIHESWLFRVFDGFHVQDRQFTPFPIAERFFTSFWLNCVQITFTLRSNCVQITFNYVQVAQKLRTVSPFESALWKAVPDNNSCPTFQ